MDSTLVLNDHYVLATTGVDDSHDGDIEDLATMVATYLEETIGDIHHGK